MSARPKPRIQRISLPIPGFEPAPEKPRSPAPTGDPTLGASLPAVTPAESPGPTTVGVLPLPGVFFSPPEDSVPTDCDSVPPAAAFPETPSPDSASPGSSGNPPEEPPSGILFAEAQPDGVPLSAPPPAALCPGAPDEAGRALRRFCLECQGNSSRHVAACCDSRCPLFAHRLTGVAAAPSEDAELPAGTIRADCANGAVTIRAVRAIRIFCLGCAGSRQEARACRAGKSCLLWSFRFGAHPRTYKAVMARFRGPRQLRLFP